MEPDAIGRLGAALPQGSAVLSATNGKTTTAAMLARILERRGLRLVHNRAGANMAGGGAPPPLGGPGDMGLFQVDEVLLDRRTPPPHPRAPPLAHPFPRPPDP